MRLVRRPYSTWGYISKVYTVCSSTHFSLSPFPSTNLLCRIWKCTGGPPKAVKPRSHVRRKTSNKRVDRGFSDPSFSLEALWLPHLEFSWTREERHCEKGERSGILLLQSCADPSSTNIKTAQENEILSITHDGCYNFLGDLARWEFETSQDV